MIKVKDLFVCLSESCDLDLLSFPLISHGASCVFFSKFIVNSFSELDKMDEHELKSEQLCSCLLRTSLKQRSYIPLKSSYSSSKRLGGFNAPPLWI